MSFAQPALPAEFIDIPDPCGRTGGVFPDVWAVAFGNRLYISGSRGGGQSSFVGA